MSNEPENKKSDSIFSPLNTIAKRLNHPALLLVFGMAIILLAAGTLALENLRLILGGLLILTILGMSAWLYQNINKRKFEPAKEKQEITTGKVSIGEDAKVKGKIDAGATVESTGPAGKITTGDITIGPGAEINDEVSTAAEHHLSPHSGGPKKRKQENQSP
jgi:membrane protein implicated in regulation of membrane protease activity